MEIKTDYSDVKFRNDGKLKLLIIVGTRPEIIRLAAVIKKCRKYFDCILAHTGQNYDYNLNGVFFKDLKLGDPEVYMNAVGDDLGATVGNIIDCSYKLMTAIRPDAAVSSHAVKQRLQSLIRAEDPAAPLSDEALRLALSALGIEVSRRAVAKYRAEMGVPSSSQRKKR